MRTDAGRTRSKPGRPYRVTTTLNRPLPNAITCAPMASSPVTVVSPVIFPSYSP